ncbi:hypothetical protein J2847_001932 [Azospirillum agricola]|uniref:hypothetical protein n=1 Tax=Azospirillum agricola TaxID=1720247 RepID=UPI001AEAD4F1|nr:hypothetical protein [Azospirillum agricola]MBP2228641.1 hypothetical protein [Azospirillum agricola]
MKQRNSAALRCVTAGLILLAMLLAPLAPVAAQSRGPALSDRCGHAVSAAISTAVSTAVSPLGPDAGMTACGHASSRTTDAPAMDMAEGDGCAAVHCHVMHAGLPLGAASLPAVPAPAPPPAPMAALLDGVGVDPALEPPRAFP